MGGGMKMTSLSKIASGKGPMASSGLATKL